MIAVASLDAITESGLPIRFSPISLPNTHIKSCPWYAECGGRSGGISRGRFQLPPRPLQAKPLPLYIAVSGKNLPIWHYLSYIVISPGYPRFSCPIFLLTDGKQDVINPSGGIKWDNCPSSPSIKAKLKLSDSRSNYVSRQLRTYAGQQGALEHPGEISRGAARQRRRSHRDHELRRRAGALPRRLSVRRVGALRGRGAQEAALRPAHHRVSKLLSRRRERVRRRQAGAHSHSAAAARVRESQARRRARLGAG